MSEKKEMRNKEELVLEETKTLSQEESQSSNRKPIILAMIGAAVLILVIILIVACTIAKKNNNENKKESPIEESQVEEIVEEEPKQPEESTEVVEGEDATIVEEVVEEEPEIVDAVQWIKDQGLKEPDIVIWDEATCTGRIIEDGQKYEVDQNDKILIVGMINELRVTPDKPLKHQQFYENYLELTIEHEGELEYEIWESVAGQTYERNFTLIYTDFSN